ncbi:MAG: response regulator transcription factor [Acidimicrobiia bacterium]|nr:response regulator transcription factor [Acidimicrobiia bacterium]
MKVIERSRLVVVDDHPLLAYGLKAQLEQAGLVVELVDPVSAPDLVDEVLSHSADLALVDLDLPFECGGVGLTRALVAAGRRVAVLTGSTDHGLWAQCLQAGALVVLTKDEPLEDLIVQVRRLLAGQQVKPHQRAELMGEYRRLEAERNDLRRGFDELSEREAAILAGLMEGLSPAGLAERDYVSVQTVRTQIKSVLGKLGVNSKLAAVIRAFEAGWSKPEDRVSGK